MKDDDEARESGTSESHSNSNVEYGPEPWKNPDRLDELYHGEGHSQYKIAERFDISQPTVAYWMDKFNIEARPPMHERDPRGIYRCQKPNFRSQYFINDIGGDTEDRVVNFYESNLVALHNEELWDVLVDDNTDVDHKLNSPLHINLPQNLRVMDTTDHLSDHANGEADIPPAFFWAAIEADDVLPSDTRRRLRKLQQWRQRRNTTTASGKA